MGKAADDSARSLNIPQWRWVVGLRLITSVFIVASLFILRFHGSSDSLGHLWFERGLIVIGLYIILAVLHHRYSANPGFSRTGPLLQISSDLALTVCLTLLSGGGDSPFVFLFLVAIINSSFLGGFRLALILATFSAALWALIESAHNIAVFNDWFPLSAAMGERSPSSGLSFRIFINTVACYLVAVLSGRLTAQIIQSRRALSQSQESLGRLEAEVKKAERLASLGEMAAGLAHEVRTPLASMGGAIHMLRDEGRGPEEREKLMAIIVREMERLERLSSDFLSFARPSPHSPQAFDLNEAISEQLKIFECSLPHGRAVSKTFAELPKVYFDKDKFIQVLWNLLKNSLEAGEKSQNLKIQIKTGREEEKPGRARMCITNNGPGIAPELMAKIFEPFFSTKSGGGGLGLPIVSRILHEGGGGISARSDEDRTSFTVFLPLA